MLAVRIQQPQIGENRTDLAGSGIVVGLNWLVIPVAGDLHLGHVFVLGDCRLL